MRRPIARAAVGSPPSGDTTERTPSSSPCAHRFPCNPHGPHSAPSPDLTPLLGVARGPGNPGLRRTLPHVLSWRRRQHSVVLSGLRVRLSFGLCTSVPHHRGDDLSRAPRPVRLLRRNPGAFHAPWRPARAWRTPTKTCPISRWACGSVPVIRGHWDDRNMDLRTRSVPGDQGVGAKGTRLRALARGRSALAAPGVPCRRRLSVGGRLQVHLVAQGLQSCKRAAGHAVALSLIKIVGPQFPVGAPFLDHVIRDR